MSAGGDRLGAAEMEELDSRPSGDFIDGYLAAMATVNASLSGADASRFFFSFDWIGAAEEPIEPALLAALDIENSGIRVNVEALAAWRPEASRLAKKWLARDLTPEAARVIASEFVEILEAFLADSDARLGVVRLIGANDAPATDRRLGAAHDHLVIEMAEGRFLLELSVDG